MARKRFHEQLKGLIWRAPVTEEVDAELRFHLEMTTRELVEGGMTPEAARAEALRHSRLTWSTSPKRRSASARAASGDMPPSTSSRVTISRWKRSSASTSSVTGAFQMSPRSCS